MWLQVVEESVQYLFDKELWDMKTIGHFPI